MIFGRLWQAFKAQLNKVANFFWESDPIALLQYEYDAAVDQLKDGRIGLEQYRALVENVERQVRMARGKIATLEAKTRVLLAEGDREAAGLAALELKSARAELTEKESQLKLHEEVYGNQLTKIKHASGKLGQLKEKIRKYDAELRMSRAEAELAKIATSINVQITTDFGEIEQALQDEIDRNRAKVKVAADLSSEGLEEIRQEAAIEKQQADDALREFEQHEQHDMEPRSRTEIRH